MPRGLGLPLPLLDRALQVHHVHGGTEGITRPFHTYSNFHLTISFGDGPQYAPGAHASAEFRRLRGDRPLTTGVPGAT